jgi:hypothetical protein
MNATIGFEFQVTATPVFHSLHDWCFQTLLLFPGAPENPEDDTVMEKHGAEELHSAVKSSIYAIYTKDTEYQHYLAHRMIQTAKPLTIRWWSVSTLATG